MTIHSTFGKLAVSLALAGAFLLPGLDARAADDTLNFVNYRDVRDLNPHLYAGEMYAQSILYDTLVSNTEDGYVGCLAEDWTISDDGRIYTFNIRDGVTFSDGTPCRRRQGLHLPYPQGGHVHRRDPVRCVCRQGQLRRHP